MYIHKSCILHTLGNCIRGSAPSGSSRGTRVVPVGDDIVDSSQIDTSSLDEDSSADYLPDEEEDDSDDRGPCSW